MAHRPKIMLAYREPKMLQARVVTQTHHTCLQSTHSMNSTGSHFNGALSSSSPLLPSRRCILELHLTSFIFLFFTVLVFLGYLPPLTSYKSPCNNLIFGSHSFCTAALNSLPDSLHSSGTFQSFIQHLKAHLYQAAFNAL